MDVSRCKVISNLVLTLVLPQGVVGVDDDRHQAENYEHQQGDPVGDSPAGHHRGRGLEGLHQNEPEDDDPDGHELPELEMALLLPGEVVLADDLFFALDERGYNTALD